MTPFTLSRVTPTQVVHGDRLEWTASAAERLDQHIDQVRREELSTAERQAFAVGADRVTEEILTRSSRRARMRELTMGLSQVLLGWGGGPVIAALAGGQPLGGTEYASLGLLALGSVLGLLRLVRSR